MGPSLRYLRGWGLGVGYALTRSCSRYLSCSGQELGPWKLGRVCFKTNVFSSLLRLSNIPNTTFSFYLIIFIGLWHCMFLVQCWMSASVQSKACSPPNVWFPSVPTPSAPFTHFPSSHCHFPSGNHCPGSLYLCVCFCLVCAFTVFFFLTFILKYFIEVVDL